MKWRLRIEERRTMEILVDAPTSEEAHRIGAEREDFDLYDHPLKRYVYVEQHLGEDGWVSGGWYDLHEPGNVVVFNRSIGNAFTNAEVTLLMWRLTDLGLHVVDTWNGEGCNNVSFMCEGRVGTDQFSDEELKLLLAGRPQS
jgi:hypothetical protein